MTALRSLLVLTLVMALGACLGLGPTAPGPGDDDRDDGGDVPAFHGEIGAPVLA